MNTPKNPNRRVTSLEDGIVYRALSNECSMGISWSYGINKNGGLALTSGGYYPNRWISQSHYWIESTDENYSSYCDKVESGQEAASSAYEWCASNGFPD